MSTAKYINTIQEGNCVTLMQGMEEKNKCDRNWSDWIEATNEGGEQ